MIEFQSYEQVARVNDSSVSARNRCSHFIYSNRLDREANKWDSLRTSIQLEMCARVEFLRVNKRRRDEKLFVGCCCCWNPTEDRRSVWFGALWCHRTHSAFLSDESHLHIDFPHRGHHRKRIRWDTQCHCAPFWLHYSSRERASAPLQGIPRPHAATAMCSAHLFHRPLLSLPSRRIFMHNWILD
jgi:hypothetical protein